jgi:hypothetical protein
VKKPLTNLGHRVTLLFLALVAAATIVHAQTPDLLPDPEATVLAQESVEVPIELVHGLPVVEVRVNGEGPYKFGIETGSPYFVISPALAAKISPSSTQPIPAPGESGEQQVLHIESITLGALTWKGVQALALGFADKSIDGVIGLPGFRDFLLTIDYPNQRVKFSKETLPAANGRDILPVSSVGPFWGVEIRAGDASFTAVIDTRSTGTFGFSPADSEKLHFDGELETVGMGRGAAFAPIPIKAGRLTSDIRLGAYSFVRPNVDVRALPAPLPQQPIMGTVVLRQFVVSLDQRSHLVRFHRDDANPITLPSPMKRMAPPPTPN